MYLLSFKLSNLAWDKLFTFKLEPLCFIISWNIVDITTPLTKEYFDSSIIESTFDVPPFIKKGTDILSLIEDQNDKKIST